MTRPGQIRAEDRPGRSFSHTLCPPQVESQSMAARSQPRRALGGQTCCHLHPIRNCPLTPAALAQLYQWPGRDMADVSLLLAKLDLDLLLVGHRLGTLPQAAGTGGSPSLPTRHRWTLGSSSPPHRRPGGRGQGGKGQFKHHCRLRLKCY